MDTTEQKIEKIEAAIREIQADIEALKTYLQ
jgi:hypothetical protein